MPPDLPSDTAATATPGAQDQAPAGQPAIDPNDHSTRAGRAQNGRYGRGSRRNGARQSARDRAATLGAVYQVAIRFKPGRQPKNPADPAYLTWLDLQDKARRITAVGAVIDADEDGRAGLWDHIGKPAQRRYLRAYALTCNQSVACKVAGADVASPWKWRADPLFAAAEQEAHELGVRMMEDEVERRAIVGQLHPVYQGRKLVGLRRERSDLLAMFRLKGERPDKYRDSQPAISVTVGVATLPAEALTMELADLLRPPALPAAAEPATDAHQVLPGEGDATFAPESPRAKAKQIENAPEMGDV